ncbi:MAG: NAD(P)-dependent oxidoreductase [Alphaproteobacteria bacterium]
MLRVFLSHEPDALANFYGARAVRELEALAEVRINDSGQVLTTEMLLAGSQGCDAVVLDRNTPADAAFFLGCVGIASVHRCAVDIRSIDVAAATDAGVLVTNASPGFVDAVVELSLGLMIDLARGITSYVSDYRRGTPPPARMGAQLSGSTLGIIGFGSIGARLAEVAHALGLTVLAHDPHKTIAGSDVRQTGLAELLGESDFVHCLATATPETENLMDEKAFAAMKAGAYFINVSRGNLVDEAALEKALIDGRLAGAAMDVGRAEDQKPSSHLARLPNVIATPHIGGQTPAAIESQALETVAQVRAVSEGTLPHNAINPDQAFRFTEFIQQRLE